ncbi:MAG: hypothetical protein ACU0CO_10185 [Shimia sp.]
MSWRLLLQWLGDGAAGAGLFALLYLLLIAGAVAEDGLRAAAPDPLAEVRP